MPRPALPPPFKPGRKKVHLPNFVVALLRTPRLDPYQAKFQVPLNFSKFDIRDYLWNLYGVRVMGVRSHVQQQPLAHDKIKNRPEANKWFRPQAKKYMTVTMDKPFRWPDPPEDMTPWDKNMLDEEKESSAAREHDDSTRQSYYPPEGASLLAEQARALLEGKQKWEPTLVRQTFAGTPARQ